MAREKREVWFAHYSGRSQVEDEDGRLTGAWKLSYGKPFLIRMTLSPESGNAFADGFGTGLDYDRTAIAHETSTGIDEDCLVWLSGPPETDSSGHVATDGSGEPETPFDYTVKKVAESVGITNVALKRRQA